MFTHTLHPATGDEPLDLSDKRYLAMDWKTSEALPGHCLIQDKEVRRRMRTRNDKLLGF